MELDWPVTLSEFHDWLDYVDKFRLLGRKFSDDQVIDVLTATRPIEEVVELFHKFRDVHGMKHRADQFQRLLLLRSTAVDSPAVEHALVCGVCSSQNESVALVYQAKPHLHYMQDRLDRLFLNAETSFIE
uniref:RXLR phytopathogen effector protein WY-domain domain-containing protein n=1 Tax=Hyaloperonospora arabidopsidis (strain Emoy2) TaxID=559515 RepID=M4BJN8_HYAAE